MKSLPEQVHEFNQAILNLFLVSMKELKIDLLVEKIHSWLERIK